MNMSLYNFNWLLNEILLFIFGLVRVIDDTHIRVKVPRSNGSRFRGRKDWTTQCICGL